MYYSISFVDHDMVMHYHFGLGVGHTYSHKLLPKYLLASQDSTSSYTTPAITSTGTAKHQSPSFDSVPNLTGIDKDSDCDDSDFNFEDSEDEFSSNSSINEDFEDEPDNDFVEAALEELIAEEMYYSD